LRVKTKEQITTSGTVSGKGTFSTNVPVLSTSAGYVRKKKRKKDYYGGIKIIKYENILDCNSVEDIQKCIEAKTSLSVPQKHQKKIAIQTLKMPDPMVGVMGGMDKKQAREFLSSIGYTDREIAKIEEGLEEKEEDDPSLKAPKEWWDKKEKEIKKGNPDYSKEQVAQTIGKIWSDLGDDKKSEIRGKHGKTFGPAPK